MYTTVYRDIQGCGIYIPLHHERDAAAGCIAGGADDAGGWIYGFMDSGIDAELIHAVI